MLDAYASATPQGPNLPERPGSAETPAENLLLACAAECNGGCFVESNSRSRV
jgi:hypothetical protein